jgi:two-component system, sensor histidine kinase and response regulator
LTEETLSGHRTPAFTKLNCLSVGLSISHARKYPSNARQVHCLARASSGSLSARVSSNKLLPHRAIKYHSRTASDRDRGFERAVRSLAAYELILIDQHMPGMNGFELLEHLQRRPGVVPPTIMMLTSGGRLGDIARCAELGIPAHLLKPVRPSELHDAIRQAMGARPAEAAPATQPDSTPARRLTPSLRVLLAEGNAVNRKVVTRLLEKRGHRVLVSTNGKEALVALKKDTFDLVLMDVQMPEMDGFEATRKIRLSEQGTAFHQRIIALTAHAMTGDRARCLEAGMDGYLTKPLGALALDQVLESCMKRDEVHGHQVPDHETA